MNKYLILTAVTVSLLSPIVNAHGAHNNIKDVAVEAHDGRHIPHEAFDNTRKNIDDFVQKNNGNVTFAKLNSGHDIATFRVSGLNQTKIKNVVDIMSESIGQKAHSHNI